MEFGNGMVQTFTPDVRNRIGQLRLYHKNAPTTYLLDLDYTLDGEGNVLSIGVDSFTYDSQNRLYTATVDGQSTAYNLDPMGNRTSVVDGGGTKTYTTTDHNLLTQAGTTQYTYDSLGNTATKTGGYEYRYDEENRLRKVLQNGQPIASYWYDAAGMRVRTSEGGSIVYYTYDGLNPIQEDDYTTGVRTNYIYAGSTRVAEKKSGVVRYFHGDHLMSTRVITDAGGVKVADYKYAPFGGTLAHTGSDTDYGFTGKHRDGTGLYYFGARYYDPEVGRWTTVDPAHAGVNWYEYCGSNPLSRIDPTGLDWVLYTGTQAIYYDGKTGDRSKPLDTYDATSGLPGYQNSKYQGKEDAGPIPEGTYKINLKPDPNREAKVDPKTGELKPGTGIEQIPDVGYTSDGQAWEYPGWGDTRAALEPSAGTDTLGRGGFYIHDSTKGYTHGCIEVESGIFDDMIDYRNDGATSIDIVIDYPSNNSSTYGGTDEWDYGYY